MIANDNEMKQLVLNYFCTKPQHKITTIFSASDLYITPKNGLTSEIKSKRRTLSRWLSDIIKSGNARVGNYEIRVFTNTIPFKYIATKV